MNQFTAYISSQFRDPNGLGGRLITLVQNIVNRAMYRAAADMTDIPKEGKLLDIGYGNGYLLQKLDRKLNADLYGIDISDDAKNMALRKNRRADRDGRLHLDVGDCCALPYADEMFDAVTSINTVYFWSDPVLGLKEIRRVLKEGASFCNVVYTKAYLDTVRYTQTGYRKYEKDELIRFGQKAGFTRITVREIAKGKSFAVICTR